jgi:hypothetical protein
MWRREERLGYWLTEAAPAPKSGAATTPVKKLVQKLKLRNLSSSVSEQLLDINSRTIDLDFELASNANVLDGLTALGSFAEGLAPFSCKIHQERLIRAASVRNLALPNEQRAWIREKSIMMSPKLGAISPQFNAPEIHMAERALLSIPEVRAEETHFNAGIGNRIFFSQLLSLPYIRESMDINLLPALEFDGFLREAEILKGLPTNGFELLAVFRSVPIELISELRFLAEKNIIIYRIATESRRTRTRVHDMAAVRDISTSAIHLVPHRTRHRTAFLN